MARWHHAQKSKNVPQMESLLQLRWLRYWWAGFQDATPNQPWWYDCKSAIELILQRANLIGTPPKRPSELAMEKAQP